MSRLCYYRILPSLSSISTATISSTGASSAARRAISSSCTARGKSTDWVRRKLWKGEAPGPEDPYTQRLEPEDSSNLPEEARDPPPIDESPAAVLGSRLALPPKQTETLSEAELTKSDPNYVPAIDADGLEEIGPLNTWWDQEGHWGEESHFQGFGSSEKVVARDVVEVYLRQAVVEALSLQETGLFTSWATKRWPILPRSQVDRVLAAEIQVSDGLATLKGDAPAISSALAAETTDGDTQPSEKIAPEEAREMIKAWNASWKEIELNDALKFALRKRLYQLTGNLLPDARLGAARTVRNFLTLVTKEVKPPKLAEILERRSELQNLANVKIHSRKIGPVEKETAMGRWKIIEAELLKRGLPVLGTAGLSRNKEKDWISEKY